MTDAKLPEDFRECCPLLAGEFASDFGDARLKPELAAYLSKREADAERRERARCAAHVRTVNCAGVSAEFTAGVRAAAAEIDEPGDPP